MPKDEAIEIDGHIVEVKRGREFLVELPNKHIINAYLAGAMTVKRIKVIEGDKVTVEVSPYDLNRGRIVWRWKNDAQKY